MRLRFIPATFLMIFIFILAGHCLTRAIEQAAYDRAAYSLGYE